LSRMQESPREKLGKSGRGVYRERKGGNKSGRREKPGKKSCGLDAQRLVVRLQKNKTRVSQI